MTAVRRLPRLVGRTQAKLDDKGRFVLPSAHRERFADDSVLVVRGDHLGLYEGTAWDAFCDELQELRRQGTVDRGTIARITNRASEVKPDNAGRITVPQHMRDAVGLVLREDVVVAGNLDYLAIYPTVRPGEADPEEEQRVNSLLNRL